MKDNNVVSANWFFRVAVIGTYFLLYMPIIALVVLSFNHSSNPYTWEGFSLRWYYALFASAPLWQAFKNSFIVAGTSVILSIIMSVLLIFYSNKKYVARLCGLFYTSVAIPELVLAVGLLSLLSMCHVPLGIMTLIAAHTVLGLGYSIPIIYSRYQMLDYRLTEASLDLGASYTQTFFKVILPLLAPALLVAGLLVFIISLDDFILSFFCAGAAAQTLPVYIFSVIRSGSSPVVNALSTMMLMVSSLLVLVFCSLRLKTRML